MTQPTVSRQITALEREVGKPAVHAPSEWGQPHARMVRLLKLCGQPAAVVTFESYASFNRYLREVNDGALVI